MAYFSNGSEGEIFDEECQECPIGKTWWNGNEEIEGLPCPVLFVQQQFNYEACNNKTGRAILNELIKQGPKGEYYGCQMKPVLEQLLKWKP